jgi:hypothetical protein
VYELLLSRPGRDDLIHAFHESRFVPPALADQVIGTPLSTRVFALLDAIWLQEVRIRELTHPGV